MSPGTGYQWRRKVIRVAESCATDWARSHNLILNIPVIIEPLIKTGVLWQTSGSGSTDVSNVKLRLKEVVLLARKKSLKVRL